MNTTELAPQDFYEQMKWLEAHGVILSFLPDGDYGALCLVEPSPPPDKVAFVLDAFRFCRLMIYEELECHAVAKMTRTECDLWLWGEEVPT